MVLPQLSDVDELLSEAAGFIYDRVFEDAVVAVEQAQRALGGESSVRQRGDTRADRQATRVTLLALFLTDLPKGVAATRSKQVHLCKHCAARTVGTVGTVLTLDDVWLPQLDSVLQQLLNMLTLELKVGGKRLGLWCATRMQTCACLCVFVNSLQLRSTWNSGRLSR